MSECTCSERREDGFVLIAVIFLTALLALLAVGFAASVRSHIRETASAVEGAKAEALADSGVQLAVLSLIASSQAAQGTRRFPINGSPVACTPGDDAAIIVRVQDTGGRVSINLAGERLLMALFIGLGASREAASRAVDLMIDYRDADNNRRPNGAERPEYEAAGRPMGPKNAPFDTIEELHQVLGLDPVLIAAALPYLTVHSQTAGLDPNAISNDVAQLLARGTAQLPAKPGPSLVDPSLLPAEFAIGSPRRVFQIASEARLSSGAIYVREAVVELQSTRSALPAFKMWQRGTATALVAPLSAPLPGC